MIYIVALVIAFTGFENGHSVPLSDISSNLTRAAEGRIVGGQDTVIQSYPYQVSLQKNGEHNCGGTILSANYVLTAAHCMPKTSAAIYNIRAGTTYREQGGSIHRIDKVILSEDTKMPGKLVGDLAILHLSDPFKFDDTRRPIGMFNAKDKVKDDQITVVTGWGRVKTSGQFAKQLQTVSVPIVNQKVCSKAYKGKVTEGQICAGYYGKGGKDACQGDSGGPMVVDGRLAGVTSWGNGCGLAKYPGVYMEVAYYRDWIKLYSGV